MMDTEEIQMSLPCENYCEDPETNSEAENETGPEKTETQTIMKRLRSSWPFMLIGIMLVLLCGVTSALFSKQQSLTESQLSLLLNNTLQEKTQLSLLLTNALQEKAHLNLLLSNSSQEKTQLSLLFNKTLHDKAQLSLLFNKTSQERTQLSLFLKNALQEKKQLSQLLEKTLREKTQLEVENKDLDMFLNSTLKDCNFVKEENRKLDVLLKESLHNITLVSAESKQLSLLLHKEQQTSMQLEAEKQHQLSILHSDKLSFLWRFCNRSTLQCSRCMPGWTEHSSRCFFLSQYQKKWEDARRECLDLGGDLAVVLNAEDQAFLTNMTSQFVQQHPQMYFHSAWIGLQDMVKEGTFIWVNGNKIHRDVIYWKFLEPNNAVASWDKDRAGQDCVAILPLRRVGQNNWLNSWDDIVCGGKRHYICETMAFSLS